MYGLLLASSLAVALWKCARAFFLPPSQKRPFAISSVSFLLLALLFAAACILSPPSGRVAWIFAAVTSVFAFNYQKTYTLAAAFIAAASISEITNTDHSGAAKASDILCLCGALIAVLGSIPAYYFTLRTPKEKSPAAPPAPIPDRTSVYSISSRPIIQLKSD